MEELKRQYQELKLRLDKLENIQNKNYKEYNFHTDHKNKPYNEQVYDKVSSLLTASEYIIKKVMEQDKGHISYRIGYITSFGNLIFADREKTHERLGYYNTGYNITLTPIVIDNIIDHEFIVQHHGKLSKELARFINEVHKILGMSELIPSDLPIIMDGLIIKSFFVPLIIIFYI